MKSRFRSLILIAAVAAALIPAPVRAEGGPTVVELFTSQGCSSCPPADELLGELAKRRDVIALSFHVDYWNYIGWRDPFSLPGSTDRQRAYKRTLKRSYIYTPQIVVDGRAQAVGSNRRSVERLIRRARKQNRLHIRLSHREKDRTRIHIPASRHKGPPATVWVAFYDAAHTTTVAAGENRGRTLTNSNVVRSFRRIGTWNGRAVTLELDHTKLGAVGRDGCAVLVQQGGAGPILGAATIPLPRN